MSQSPAAPLPGGPAPDSPIADVSYRNYDGPLLRHRHRWWIIARTMIALALKRRGLYVLGIFAMLPAVLGGFVLFLRNQTAEMGSMSDPKLFAYGMNEAYNGSLFWLFLITLTAGAGTIAADNRANALQVYLSRPLTKNDYLAGKWTALFLILFVVGVVPLLVLYLFCLGSFHEHGFLKNNPNLIAHLMLAAALPAVLHASLIVGFSACTNRPLLAGGLYAGLYVGLPIILAVVALILSESGHPKLGVTVGKLSIGGVLDGIALHVFDVVPSLFGQPLMRAGRTMPPNPYLGPLLAAYSLLVVGGLAVARARIRAVEVVRG